MVQRHAKREVQHVRSYAEAIAAIARPFQYCGLLLDIELSKVPGAKTGFDVLAIARRREPRIPAAMLTGYVDAPLVRRAAELEALYLPKPATLQTLRRFLREALAYDGASTVDVVVEEVLSRYGIRVSTVGAEIVRLRAGGLSSAQAQAKCGIKPTTYKSHVRRLLELSGHERITSLVEEIWRLHAERAPQQVSTGLLEAGACGDEPRGKEAGATRD